MGLLWGGVTASPPNKNWRDSSGPEKPAKRRFTEGITLCKLGVKFHLYKQFVTNYFNLRLNWSGISSFR